MTATPPERLVHAAESGVFETHVLPSRPHGHPLPVPDVLRANGEDAYWGEVERRVRSTLGQGRRVILFVPTVRLGYKVAERLRVSDRSRYGRVEYVHGGDRGRADKLRAAEKGEIDVLVSTTVLERGVTIPGVDVVVVGADDERVFDSAALIQMAGRTGRRAEDPYGSVAFACRRWTPAMRAAIHAIESLNRLAMEEANS